MARGCEQTEHTADVGLDAWGDSLGEVLAALAEGLADVICDRSAVRAAECRDIRVQAEDVEALTVDFLSEVLLAFDADRFITAGAQLRADEHSVTGELLGEPFDPDRHEFRTEVKAVTYHELCVRRDGDIWRARVLLDL